MILQTNYRTLESGVVVLELQGKLTAGTTLTMLELELKKLVGAQATKLVVDMSGLSYLDSAGVGMLMASFGAARSAGGNMAVAVPQGRVRTTLELTHVDRVLPMTESVDRACETV